MQTSFGGVFEARELEIARERFVSGEVLGVSTFGGMPFLEKPPLFSAMLAWSFEVSAGPSLLSARIVVALIGMLWLASAFLCARRVAGRRAGLVAAGLTALTPAYLTLARRVSLDDLLAAVVTLALASLAAAASSPQGPLRRLPWLMFLLATGAAFLTKGPFGTFLVLAPLAVYAVWARDRRILDALLRPSSLVLLALPCLLWAAVLYEQGGPTYLAEAFLNNSFGRFVGTRYDIAGTVNLPYGDVNGPSAMAEYLVSALSLMGLAVVAVPFAGARMLRRRPRSRRDRTSAMALSWALVPIVLLTFSSQKGTHHLGACTSGFAVAAALWVSPRLRARGASPLPRWTGPWIVSLGALAPVVLLGTLAGRRPDVVTASVVGALLVGVATLGIRSAWRSGHRFEAACGVLASLAGAVVLGYAAHGSADQDAGVPGVAHWLREEIGASRVAIFHWGDTDLGTFAFAMDHDVTPLSKAEAVGDFLATPEPAYCIVRGGLSVLGSEGTDASRRGVYAHVSGGGRRYTILANPAAFSRSPVPRAPPPGEWEER